MSDEIPTPTSDQIKKLAEELTGSCGGPSEDQLERLGIHPSHIDDIGIQLENEGEIFVCATCGWWCEVSEMCDPDAHNGEQVCAECEND